MQVGGHTQGDQRPLSLAPASLASQVHLGRVPGEVHSMISESTSHDSINLETRSPPRGSSRPLISPLVQKQPVSHQAESLLRR